MTPDPTASLAHSIAALSGPNRAEAIQQLGASGDSQAVPTLIADNLTCGEYIMQVEACRLLGALGAPRTIPALIRARDTGHAQLHDAAIAALSVLGWTP